MLDAQPWVAVVDDDESVGRALQRLLRTAGIGARIFRSGEDFLGALGLLAAQSAQSGAYGPQPGCAVLDVQLPGLSGLAVQRRIAHTGMPVIVITARDEAGVRDEAYASGAVSYLHKPFDGAHFIHAVQAALGIVPAG
ncbi:response regulator transcription factor [Paraburkholderia unamae]|uniref:Response regulator receiver domain-containing protein n=1 Tax=Paraburkholderia unamae TaxID=219649 RepID=A0ABX5KAS4_9BURK|nr:response regulator [Paraburkholderia unamae]PVX72284.1 response regulator receiver domain-containing protein [Paraburkholderia unamae]CAG9259316.1 Histidine kinase [Paraburkholderia unamae]